MKKQFILFSLTLSIIAAMMFGFTAHAATIYVKPASAGGSDDTGDGLSWETAYATPTKASKVAAEASDNERFDFTLTTEGIDETSLSLTGVTDSKVESGSNVTISFAIAADKNYLYVLVNGVYTVPAVSDGTYTVTLSNVTAPQTVKLTGYYFPENVLPVTEDTYYRYQGPNGISGNNANEVSMMSRGSGGYAATPLLRFVPTPAQKAAGYNKATLKLVFSSQGNAGTNSYTYTVGRVPATYATINDVPNSVNTNASNLGAWTQVGTVSASIRAVVNASMSLDVTDSYVLDMPDNIRLGVFKGAANNYVYFHSIENGNPEYVPVLVFSAIDTISIAAAEGITLQGATTVMVERGTAHSFTFSVEDGYENPQVTINKVPYTLGEAVEGVYTVNIPATTGNVNVEITCEAEYTCQITVIATNVEVTSPELTDGKYTSGASSTIYFTVDEHYENPVVTVNETPVTPTLVNGRDYSVKLTDISGATTVNILASLINYTYTVTAANVVVSTTYAGTYTVEDNAPAAIEFTVDAGYHLRYAAVNGVKAAVTQTDATYSISTPQHVTSNTAIVIYAFPENVLPVTEDTYVSNKSTETNFSTATTVNVAGDIINTYTNTKGYLYFDFSALRDDLWQKYNKARLFVTWQTSNTKTFNEWLSVRSVKEEVKTTGLTGITWTNSGETASTYSGDELGRGTVAISTPAVPANTKDSVDLSASVFEALQSDGKIYYQLALISDTGGDRNDGHLASLHSLENGNPEYVPVLIFSTIDTISIAVTEGITLIGENTIKVERGSAPSFTFTVETGYGNLAVTIDEVPYTLGEAVEGVYTVNIPATAGNVKVEISCDKITAVLSVSADSVPARYFNLQGVEVRQPVRGNIYIVKQGAKITKALYQKH